MKKIPGAVWAGSFDEQLYRLITIFASVDLEERVELPGPYARSLFFDEHTVETLCNAVVEAEDAVISSDSARKKSYHLTSILTETEKQRLFSTANSPFHGPLVGLANIARDYTKEGLAIDADAWIYQPLRKHWSRMIRRLWDHPARSLGTHDKFREERYLVPFIFCRIAEAERSFASVIDDESDLTISLMTRHWVHATGEDEMNQLFIFLMMLIPRRPAPGPEDPTLLSLYLVREGEPDNTVAVLRRILQSNDFIAEFIEATASQLRRFRGFEANIVMSFLDKLWNWARAFRQDPLCSEFLSVIRTSAPFWSSLFDASSRSTRDSQTDSFHHTPHYYMSILAFQLICSRDSSSHAIALTDLWISTGVFDALEVSLGEVLRRGTDDEQVDLCSHLARIYYGISYGPQDQPWLASLLRQQLPRPRTVRRLWDISLNLSGKEIRKVATSHVCRMAVVAMEACFILPNACKRRGCEKTSTARCVRCRLDYCGIECQKRDWKDHKMVCGVEMDMDSTVKDEALRLTQLWMGK